MARDYKRRRKTTKKKNTSSPWVFLGYGFALGLIAALALYLNLRPDIEAAPDRPVPNAALTPKSSSDSEIERSTEPAPQPTTAKVDTPPVNPLPVDSDFLFYDELPDFEVVLFDEENQPLPSNPPAARPKQPAAAPSKPSTYILQAGSFRKFIDADRRKAELAFKGIESDIKQVNLDESGIWYRVYVGPGSDFAAFETMRSELRRSNIDVLILRARQ